MADSLASLTEPPEAGKAMNDDFPEKEIIRQAQKGDPGAFERIYRRYNRRVYALCLRMTKNQATAEDLTQEAFLQVFRKIHTFRGESAFYTWFHRLTVNVVLMSLRKRKSMEVSWQYQGEHDGESGLRVQDAGAADPALSGLFDRENLNRALGRMPKGYKRVLVLYDVFGYEHNEIAVALECSTGNSKSQLHKARERMRSLL
ncbi:MAG: sigma-24, subfamily [Candidatus Acidoferrum typicum]|nr:sigma-24, subfamily [Candidatus Acidoferrum typicum]